MTMITRWTPMHDLAAVEVERLNRMFSNVFGDAFASNAAWTPAVDIFEAQNHDLIVKAELPAMKKEDIKVSVEQNVLTLEGERKFDDAVAKDQYHRLERGFGAFRRSFTLPATIDAARISAAYVDGVLTITIPQREEAKAREVHIN
jgi:HSP20 family protein